MKIVSISTKMSTPEKRGGQNAGRPLHFKKSGDMSPVHRRIYTHVTSHQYISESAVYIHCRGNST